MLRISYEWREGVKDVNLVDVVGAQPIAPVPHGSTFVVTAAGQWKELNVEVNDVVSWNAITNKFQFIRRLVAGDRYIVAAYGDTVAAGIMAAFDKKIVHFKGGVASDAGNWELAETDPLANGTVVQNTEYRSITAFCDFIWLADEAIWYTDSVSVLSDPLGYYPPQNYGATKLTELTDVNLADPINDDQVLTYEDGVWINKDGGGSGGATSLADLSDVTLTNPATGEVLQYNGTSWVNVPMPSASSAETVVVTAPVGDSALVVGDAVALVNGALVPASAAATDPDLHLVVGVVTADATSGTSAQLAVSGAVTITGLGIAENTEVFLDVVAGKLTVTPPSGEGEAIVSVGFVIDTDVLLISPKAPLVL